MIVNNWVDWYVWRCYLLQLELDSLKRHSNQSLVLICLKVAVFVQ